MADSFEFSWLFWFVKIGAAYFTVHINRKTREVSIWFDFNLNAFKPAVYTGNSLTAISYIPEPFLRRYIKYIDATQ